MSMRKAINDKCKDCIYDELEPGTWRKQVENCKSSAECPLWTYRPTTTKRKIGPNRLQNEAQNS